LGLYIKGYHRKVFKGQILSKNTETERGDTMKDRRYPKATAKPDTFKPKMTVHSTLMGWYNTQGSFW
jgi:hypothetical protein